MTKLIKLKIKQKFLNNQKYKLTIFRLLWIFVIYMVIVGVSALIGLGAKGPTVMHDQPSIAIVAQVFKQISRWMLYAGLPLMLSAILAGIFSRAEHGAAVVMGTIGYVSFVAAIASLLTIYNMFPSSFSETEIQKFLISREHLAPYEIGNPHSWERFFNMDSGYWSLNTSWLGGVIIGLLTAFIHNVSYAYQAPKILGFFSGVRFIPIPVFIAGALAGIVAFYGWELFVLPNALKGYAHA